MGLLDYFKTPPYVPNPGSALPPPPVRNRNSENMTEESKKNDRQDNKPRWELLPLTLLGYVVDVYTAGAKKYGPNQWQNLPDGYNRYKAALFRHLVAYESGEIRDPETGCYHLAQVVWNALAMLYFSLKKQ